MCFHRNGCMRLRTLINLFGMARKIVNYFYNFPEVIKEKIYVKSYELVRYYAVNGDISSIQVGEKSIVTLKDGRSYNYDPCSRIDRLYSLPFKGEFEAGETELCRKIIKNGDVCVDVGASFGWYTILFSNLVGVNGHVHAFEPVRLNYNSLSENIDLNKISNITANNVALGESNRGAKIFVSDVDTSGSLKLRDYRRSYLEEHVVVTTLDGYVGGNMIPAVDFIKADIEGAELLMLRGAREVIAKHLPILFLEIQAHSTALFNYSPADIMGFLCDLGYDRYVNKGGFLSDAKNIYEGKEYNFFFVHSTKKGLCQDLLIENSEA